MSIDFSNFKVLITGGTKGLGLATGLAFAEQGAQVYLTHRWGSADEDLIRKNFSAKNYLEPIIICSDVADASDNKNLMQEIKAHGGQLDAIISNVAFSQIIEKMVDLKKKSLDLSLNYSAWPIVSLTQTAEEVFGQYPRYIVGISSDGGEVCHAKYDLAGSSKAVLETLCRYLALHLKDHKVNVNAIRPGFLNTDSSRATFGEAKLKEIDSAFPGIFLEPEKVAKVCVALCSGLMDCVSGQVIVADECWSLVSPISYITHDLSDVCYTKDKKS